MKNILIVLVLIFLSHSLFVGSAPADPLQGDNVDPGSRVGILRTPNGRALMGVLNEFGESARYVKYPFSAEDLADLDVLIIPTYGLEQQQTSFHKQTYNEFLMRGGRILVMSQKFGSHFGILPAYMTAYGSRESSSQTTSNVWIEEEFIDHPVFSSISSRVFSLPLDGHFFDCQGNATVMARSVVNNAAVVVRVQVGAGMVVYTPARLETDRWDRYGRAVELKHQQGRLSEGEMFLRDLINWLKDPEESTGEEHSARYPKSSRTYSPKEITATVVANKEYMGSEVPAVFEVIVTNDSDRRRHLKIVNRFHRTWGSGIVYHQEEEQIFLEPGKSHKRRLTMKSPGYRSPNFWCMVYDLEARGAIVASAAKKVFYNTYPVRLLATAAKDSAEGDSIEVHAWDFGAGSNHCLLAVSAMGVPAHTSKLSLSERRMVVHSIPVKLPRGVPDDDITRSIRCVCYGPTGRILGECDSDVAPFDKMKILKFSLHTDKDVYLPGEKIKARLSFFNRSRRNLPISFKMNGGVLGSFEGSVFAVSADVAAVEVVLDVPRYQPAGRVKVVTSFWDNMGSHRDHAVEIVIGGSVIASAAEHLYSVMQSAPVAPLRLARAPVRRLEVNRIAPKKRVSHDAPVIQKEPADSDSGEAELGEATRPVFNHALCAFGSVELLDNFVVSGYEDETGKATESGHAVAHGDLSLHNGAQVRGDAVAGGSVSISSDAIVHSDLYLGGKLDMGRRAVLRGSVRPLSVAPRPCECGYDLDGILEYRREHNDNSAKLRKRELRVEGRQRIELEDGVYFFESIELKDEAVLSVKPGAQVELYVSGELAMLDESALINDPSNKGSLLVVAGADAGKGERLVIRTGRDLSLWLYAPRADVFYGGKARLLGALVVRNFHGEGVGGLWMGESYSVSPVPLACEWR